MTEGIAHQALYRRWRAQTFSEIVGQEAVVATLRNAVLTGRVAHAILFTGPRGTGKTSLARILAKAINCSNLAPNGDPCDRCPACVSIREGRALDLVEIDAASNRGIDSIRDLRDRLAYAPQDLRRKVYILDEAHQITKDGWNALLKSLEEPPEFVTFMFASTHPQDFPPAILSRVQRFDVRRFTVAEIAGKLDRILAADGRDVDPEAVRLVARLAAGGMRDAESILDQLLSSTSGRIEAEAVRDLLGLADAESVRGYLVALVSGDAAGGISVLDGLEERGRDLRVFLDQTVEALRDRMLEDVGAGRPVESAVVSAARRLAAIDTSRLGAGGLRLQLELALLDASIASSASPPPFQAPVPSPPGAVGQATATPASAGGVPSATERRAAPDAAAPAAPAKAAARSPVPTEAASPDAPAPRAKAPAAPRQAPAAPPEPSPAAAPEVKPATPCADDLERLRHGWPQVISIIGANPSLRPLILDCRPIGVEANVVTLAFPEEKAFFKDVAERRRSNLETGLAQFLGHDVGVRCVATNFELVPPLPSDVDEARILDEAHRIFAEDLADVPEIT
ncbi:MAG: DNA polymerase III subunit gamma/tau [Candidatus Limnocylindrales bacterium]